MHTKSELGMSRLLLLLKITMLPQPGPTGVAGGSVSGAFGANCALNTLPIDSLRPLSSTPKARLAVLALE